MTSLGYALAAMFAVAVTTAAQAQHHEGGHDHAAPSPPAAAPPPASSAQAGDSGHAGHDVMTPAEKPIPQGTPPAPPLDHAADRIYDAGEMAAAREALKYENGGMPVSMILLDRLEYRSVRGADGYHWEGGGFIGGDIDRFAFKTQGEGERHGRLEQAEFQALYSHAIGPYFNLQTGVRHDFQLGPQRSYAVAGVDGLAPYWFDVGAALFLSNKGDLHARVEASYDQRITQRLILQPQAELNFSAQDVPELRLGAGLSKVEMGMRLRYEIAREIAPYVGVFWERDVGATADFARLAGERRSSTGLVMGIRFWL